MNSPVGNAKFRPSCASPDGRISIYMILAMIQPRCHLANRSRTGGVSPLARRMVAVAGAGLLLAVTAWPQSGGRSPAAKSAASAPGSTQNSSPLPAPDKGRARKAYETGRRAEQGGDWKAEFAAYSEAATYDPSNREYRMLREHARFQVIQSLVDRAERQAIAGDVSGARALLTEALSIDPNYVVARERLAELTPQPVEVEPARGPRLGGLPRLNLAAGTHAFDYRGTTRGAYEELGRQFGVKMVFDGDLVDRSLRFQVPALDFDTAVMVLARQTRTFTRVVDSQTMFVTEDTAQKQRDYTLEVEKQLPLPASVTTDEMNETVRMIREMTGITRTQLNTATRTLTVRSNEQNVALAQTLLQQIEQPRGELMLDIEILEVNRTGATQLGITPPTSGSVFMLSLPEVQQLRAAQNSGTLIQVLQSVFGSSAVSSATGSALPALIAFGGGKTIFLATMPSVSANFGTALSTVRSARRILLRAQDGKPATFFVGDRYPIDLGLLSSDLNSSSTALAAAVQALASGATLPRTDYATGVLSVSVAVADFNKDGNPDIVAANKTDGTLSILFGNGDGTFQTQTTITIPVGTTAAANPSAVATGDFNGDGNQDIAVADMTNDRVLILLGNGDGTFQAPVAYPTGSNPVALLAQDFDGEGQPDLAVVNRGDGTTPGSVSILIGDKVNNIQNGIFGAKIDYPVGVAPSAIAAGTLITNGFTSLAVTNTGDNTVSILLGNGSGTLPDGTFSVPAAPAPAAFATGASPAGVAIADFNNDGKPDLAVTYATDTAGNSVSILLGNGDGTFATANNFAAGSGPVGIVAAAFAGSNIDLAVADETGNNVDVLVGNGDGTFATPISLPTGNGPAALAAADLNNDTTLDLVTADSAANSVTVTLNTLQSGLGSSGGNGQVGYPSAEYEDLGVKIKATPRLHAGDEVTLQLQFDLKNLTGTSINGIPILSNRNIEQTIRLREDETSVLSGLLQSHSIKGSSGLPWSSIAPGVGLLTGEDTSNAQSTELLILVTPRALRLPPRNAPTVYAGRGEPSTPPPAPQQGPPQPPPPGAQQIPGPPPGRGGFGSGFPPGQGPGANPQQQQYPQPQQQAPDPNQR